jgi:MoxR-like ATPase
MSAQLVSIPTLNLQNLRKDLKGSFIQRDEEIDILFVSLLASEHCLFLGDPGTAKSLLGEVFAKSLGLGTWAIQMMRTTKPDEVFGAPSLADYEKGIVKRITANKLPETEFAIVDEIFKCNSAILNSLLSILNERKFYNPGPMTVPLEMAVGMSNEGPDGGSDGELGALWDRFLLRTWVKPLKAKADKLALLYMDKEPGSSVQVSREEINALRELVKNVVLSDEIKRTIVDIEEKIQQDQIKVSNRRLRKSMKIVKAAAVLEGRDTAQISDLWILKHMFWNEEDEISKVHSIVIKASDPDFAAARKILKTAHEDYKELMKEVESPDKVWVDYGHKVINVQVKVKKLNKDMKKLTQSTNVKKCSVKIQEMADAVQDIVNSQMS